MIEPVIWIIGGGGLLGSHMRSALARRFPRARLWESRPVHLAWTDPDRLEQELHRAVSDFTAVVRARGSAWAVVWCAGKGAVGSPAAALEPEWSAWSMLLDLLGRSLAKPHMELPGFVFLASSAGGVYGGNSAGVLTEQSLPRPASDYGSHKLRMESAMRDWSDAHSNVSCLIGRITTLYGPGQDLSKPQGVISHLSRCLIHHRQVSIYVPLDTRRDYVFVGDCADHIAACLGRLMAERPRMMLKIFAGERSTSLAQIVGIFLRISKHRSLIASRQARIAQSISMNFRSDVWRDTSDRRKTDLAAGIHLLHAYQMALFQRGLLPPP